MSRNGRRENLLGLLSLAEVVLVARQANYAKKLGKASKHLSALDELEANAQRGLAGASGTTGLATQLAVQGTFLKWSRKQRDRLTVELAKARAESEYERHQLLIAFRRYNALRQICKKLKLSFSDV